MREIDNLSPVAYSYQSYRKTSPIVGYVLIRVLSHLSGKVDICTNTLFECLYYTINVKFSGVGVSIG